MKKLFNTKFKKIICVVFVIAIILSASLIRIVPNYSKKYGFEIIGLHNYDLYQKGFCFHDRSIDIKKLYEKVIGEYLDKELEIEQKHNEIICDKLGQKSSYCVNTKINYYIFEDINLENLYKIFDKYLEEDNIYSKIFDFNSHSKANPKDYLIVDLDTMTAGFSKPIFFNRNHSYFMLDYDFAFDRYDGILSRHNRLVINHIKIFKNDDIQRAKKKYYFKKYNNYFKSIEFDNCGNLNFNVQKEIGKRVKSDIDWWEKGG